MISTRMLFLWQTSSSTNY